MKCWVDLDFKQYQSGLARLPYWPRADATRDVVSSSKEKATEFLRSQSRLLRCHDHDDAEEVVRFGAQFADRQMFHYLAVVSDKKNGRRLGVGTAVRNFWGNCASHSPQGSSHRTFHLNRTPRPLLANNTNC